MSDGGLESDAWNWRLGNGGLEMGDLLDWKLIGLCVRFSAPGGYA